MEGQTHLFCERPGGETHDHDHERHCLVPMRAAELDGEAGRRAAHVGDEDPEEGDEGRCVRVAGDAGKCQAEARSRGRSRTGHGSKIGPPGATPVQGPVQTPVFPREPPSMPGECHGTRFRARESLGHRLQGCRALPPYLRSGPQAVPEPASPPRRFGRRDIRVVLGTLRSPRLAGVGDVASHFRGLLGCCCPGSGRSGPRPHAPGRGRRGDSGRHARPRADGCCRSGPRGHRPLRLGSPRTRGAIRAIRCRCPIRVLQCARFWHLEAGVPICPPAAGRTC